MKAEHLLFVYNADSGLFSLISDFAHKILSPATYACNLCALTYGHFSEKQEWKTFIASFPVKSVFLHKDEFLKQYKTGTAFPAVFIKASGEIKEIITRPEIEGCRSIDDLKNLMLQKYDACIQHHHTNL